MTPNFIDALAAGESFPAWFFPMLGALIVAGMLAALIFGVWLARRDFRRDMGEAMAIVVACGPLPYRLSRAPHLLAIVLAVWEQKTRPIPHIVWVRVIPEAAYDVALHEADTPPGNGERISGTVSGPRHEYRWRWLTRAMGGQIDVYTVTVRDREGDPGGARALCHELGCHLWPKLKGQGWNREDGPHEGHTNESAAEVARDLEGVLK